MKKILFYTKFLTSIIKFYSHKCWRQKILQKIRKTKPWRVFRLGRFKEGTPLFSRCEYISRPCQSVTKIGGKTQNVQQTLQWLALLVTSNQYSHLRLSLLKRWYCSGLTINYLVSVCTDGFTFTIITNLLPFSRHFLSFLHRNEKFK